METRLQYRPDIDGLRALAIISVVLYHAYPDMLRGGFVGVDVFFVISGYLITSIIYSEHTKGIFSIRKFWLRRVRRILPAAFFVMIITSVAFAFVYPANLYKDLGQSLTAQNLFVSNILFWKESGYFDTAAEVKPLLHTWSLSVEEQFYFIFPILFLLVYKLYKPGIILILLSLCAFSFLLSVWGTERYPDAAFYLLPTRAWELGVGSILALLHFQNDYKALNTTSNNILALIGVGLIFWSIFNIDNTVLFPSYYAAFPVFGAMALIHANTDQDTVFRKILSFKILVGIGLISYSLYLWHWPVLTFNKYVQYGLASNNTIIVSIIISIILAIFSYYFVEQPFRKNTKIFTNKRLISIAATLSITLIVTGVVIHFTDGLPERNDVAKKMAARDDFSTPKRAKECQDKFDISSNDFVCKSDNYNKYTNRPFLVWGDSHTTFMVPAFQFASKRLEKRFFYTSYSGCPPIFNIRMVSQPSSHKCKEFNDAVFEFIKENNIHTVYLVFRHNVYIEGYDRINRDIHRAPLIHHFDENLPKYDANTAFDVFSEKFLYTLGVLNSNSTNVVVVHQIPNLNINPRDMLAKTMSLGYSTEKIPTRPRREFEERTKKVAEFFSKNNINLIDFTNRFCDESSCYAFREGKSLYRDNSHIGIYGIQEIKEDLTKYIKEYH